MSSSMDRTSEDERLVAEQLARHQDLRDVLLRHGMTEGDLVRAHQQLSRQGLRTDDLWTLITQAARTKRQDQSQ